MKRQNLSVALIGGGRWARVHAAVLQGLRPPIGRLLWVSRHNRDAIGEYRTGLVEPKVEIVESLDAALSCQPNAAVICTASVNHARDALTVLNHGVPVLVEKPLALDMSSANELLAIAEDRRLTLYVCLPLLKASYILGFKVACAGRAIASMHVAWFDTPGEVRYGEIKQPDPTTHKVDEIIPHLWSLVHVLIGSEEPRILATALGGSDSASISLICGRTRVDATFGRRAAARTRRVRIRFADNGVAELDFTREPGTATIDGSRCESDTLWERELRPLASIHSSFLDRVANRGAENAPSSLNAAWCIGSIALAQEVRRRIVAQEAERTVSLLRSGHSVRHNPELFHLIIDNLGPELAQLGFRVDPSDRPAQRRLAKAAAFKVLQWAGVFNQSDTPEGGVPDTALASSAFVGQMLRHFRGREH